VRILTNFNTESHEFSNYAGPIDRYIPDVWRTARSAAGRGMSETRSAQCSVLSPACDWLSAKAPTPATAAPCKQSFTCSLLIYLVNLCQPAHDRSYRGSINENILAEWPTQEYNRLCETNATKYWDHIYRNIDWNFVIHHHFKMRNNSRIQPNF